MREGWKRITLGELLDVQNGFAFDSKKFADDGDMPLIRIRDLKNGVTTATRYSGAYESKYVVRAGDLLIGMDGEFACHQWKGGPALLNQRVCRLHNFSSSLLPRFLFYGINKFLKEIEDVTTFTTVKHLSAKQIKAIEFPVPHLPEQKRIVAILDEAFAGIATAVANTEKNLENARELFDSYLNAAFDQQDSGDATKQGWSRKKLQEACQKVTVGHVGKTSAYYSGEGVLFLRTQNVGKHGLDLTDVKFVTPEFHNSLKKSQVLAGDVLISRVVTDEMRCAIFPPDLGEANCANIILLRPREGLDSTFLYYCVNSPSAQQYLLDRRVGSAQQVVNTRVLREWEVSLPSLPEQKRIVAILDELSEEIRRLQNIYQRKLVVLAELKQSLLKKAFSGELTAEKQGSDAIRKAEEVA